MIEVIITPKMIQEAEYRNSQFYKKYKNLGTHRIDKKRQRITGYLAEIAIKSIFPNFEYSLSDDVDFILNKKTFDVKAQGCNTKPKDNYVGTLYQEQDTREVDYYIFTRVKNDSSVVWIMGFISKTDFLKKAILVEKGFENNNFIYDQSRYEIEYKELINLNNILEDIT